MIDSPLAFPNGAYGHPGMTLRDYFAAKALQGLLLDIETMEPKRTAEIAYLYADAMLKARGE